MSDDDDHRELADYVPGDGPVRRPVARHVMRVVVIIGLIGLVLPGLVVTIGTQVSTAATACRIVVEGTAPDAVSANERFELMGPEGPGWYCYARQFDGSDQLLRFLGLIPGLRIDPDGTQGGVPA
jgi:hypothetical protein